jgi:hypothetical protein
MKPQDGIEWIVNHHQKIISPSIHALLVIDSPTTKRTFRQVSNVVNSCFKYNDPPHDVVYKLNALSQYITIITYL